MAAHRMGGSTCKYSDNWLPSRTLQTQADPQRGYTHGCPRSTRMHAQHRYSLGDVHQKHPVWSYVSSIKMARIHNQIFRHRAEAKCPVEETTPQPQASSFPLKEKRIREGMVKLDSLYYWWKWKWLLRKQLGSFSDVQSFDLVILCFTNQN